MQELRTKRKNELYEKELSKTCKQLTSANSELAFHQKNWRPKLFAPEWVDPNKPKEQKRPN